MQILRQQNSCVNLLFYFQTISNSLKLNVPKASSQVTQDLSAPVSPMPGEALLEEGLKWFEHVCKLGALIAQFFLGLILVCCILMFNAVGLFMTTHNSIIPVLCLLDLVRCDMVESQRSRCKGNRVARKNICFPGQGSRHQQSQLAETESGSRRTFGPEPSR